MTSTERSQARLTRREFLKLTGSFSSSLLFSQVSEFEQVATEYQLSENSPPEEIPGGIDMTLSEEEIREFEKQWLEVENIHEFERFQDYLAKFSILLNLTRARNIKGDGFTHTISEFIGTGATIRGKKLYIVGEIQDSIPFLSNLRDGVLDGRISSATYGLWLHAISQAMLYSYIYDIWETEYDAHENFGRNELAYTQFVMPQIAKSAIELEDHDKMDYYTSLVGEYGELPADLFNVKVKDLKEGIIQRKLSNFDEISFGDTIFKDISTGYKLGHPQLVLVADRNHQGKVEGESSTVILDGNVDGRMIAGIYQLDNFEDFKYVLYGENMEFGVLRTKIADSDLYLRRLNFKTMLKASELPAAINEGRQEVFPDFENIPEIKNLWQKFRTAEGRSEAINEIINLIGLHVRNEAGEVILGPRWTSNFGNNYWLCNIYSTFLIKALGINDLGHWFKNNEPSNNEGEEYDVARMFEYLNLHGRRKGWINVTHLSTYDRLKMLSQGYVFYGVTRGHTWVILPLLNQVGEIVPALSQDGYDIPIRYPNFSYKFIRPRSSRSYYPNDDPPQYDMVLTEGCLWAYLLPNAEAPDRPYRSPLFGHNIPETKNILENATKIGWLTTIEDLKNVVGESTLVGFRKFMEKYVEGITVKLPTDNHIFQYGFDLVKIIQRYTLPLRVSPEKDAEYFVEYLKQSLIDLGYGRLLNSKYAKGVLNNIQLSFVSHEEHLRTGKPFQPLKCYYFVQLLEMGRDHIDWAPALAGGLAYGNAQQIAESLMSVPTQDGVTFVDETTEAIHFPNDYPTNLEQFKAGDTFFIAYSGNSEGHVGTILTDPFLDKNGNRVVVVADSNRYVDSKDNSLNIVQDGMPRIRIMTYESFILNFLTNKELTRNGKLIVLRPTKK